MEEWKRQVKALFFTEHMAVTDIVKVVKKSRKTISAYVNDCEGYAAEMAFRRECAKKERKEYQRAWDRKNRSGVSFAVNGQSLRQEHDTAARILSAERYFRGE